MAAKGYTTGALVAAELGRTLSAGQLTQADILIEEAEAFIDRVTGRAWLVASPVTDETHEVIGGTVYLYRTPVATVTSVEVRSRAIGGTDTALVAGTSYELLDAARGILSVGWLGSDVLVKVAYTHTSPLPVPVEIQGLATRLVALRMTPRLEPLGQALESISVGQGDLALKYRSFSEADLSDCDQAVLFGYRRLVFA